MGDAVFDTSSHGSIFGRNEERLLRITVKETDDPSMIFPGSLKFIVPAYLKHLELDKVSVSQILKYRPHDYPRLSASQRLFLQRLQDVLLNRLDASSKFDLYLHDLVGYLIRECQLNDGLKLYVRFSKLALRAGTENYTLFSDREGRSSEEIVWILQESIHKFDTRYKKGDIQLAASMIAACQANLMMNKGELKVKTLYGLKVLGEEFFFCRIDFETEYLKQLRNKLPAPELTVYRYPPSRGLRISKPDDRKKLLYFMYRLRDYALNNPQAEGFNLHPQGEVLPAQVLKDTFHFEKRRRDNR